jgi:hypothetical protein
VVQNPTPTRPLCPVLDGEIPVRQIAPGMQPILSLTVGDAR